MKKLGIEIEFTGITREEVINALENLFNNKRKSVFNTSVDNPYYYYSILDKFNNKWLVLRDRSINTEKFISYKNYEYTDDTSYACELVSPVLTSETLPVLFEILAVLRALGAKTNESCGIHIHIDTPSNTESIINLVKKFIFSQEEIFSHFGVADNRVVKYCKKYENFPLDREFESFKEFLDFMYDTYTEKGSEKRTLRYYGLNIHSIKTHNTIEFRIFNSSLDSKVVAEIIDWVLHFCYSIDEISKYTNYLMNMLSVAMKE